MFDWIPLYKEIARKLLEFEHRQAELLDLVRQIGAKGIPVVSLKDKSGAGEVELAEIDPFTFFACFNRQTVADNRRAILQELKQAWNLAAPIPSDFEGIPVVNNQQSWFFPYLTRRGKDDISKLWRLARETVEKTAETFDWQLLQNCIAIKAVNLPKLTMGMFWMRPDQYLAVDSKNKRFLKKRQILLPTDAHTYLRFLKDVMSSLGHDFPSLSREAHLETEGEDAPPAPAKQPQSNRRYWWLNANPKIWNFEALPIGLTQTYSSHNESGNKRQKYKYFGEVSPGDLVVGYVTSPPREVVAICEITKGLHSSPTGERIEFKKTEHLRTPVTYEELKGNPALELSEPLINHQGSLFALTEEEYEVIRAIVDAKNVLPPSSAPEAYTKADGLAELFMSEPELDETVRRLRRKKNIVLQGPPGVGKTFLAKRLAYLMMEKKDSSRVEMIQFHQSYSYEDFIQGFRPLENGGFAIKPGIFYGFCRRAQRDQNNDYFFIIDEINRGNLSKIFGELMLLLEHDKRGSAFSIPLTYSVNDEDKFYIPENLYFIGTMNTADRSLSIVDYALRRRFVFVNLKPQFGSGFEKALRNAGTSSTLITKIQQRIGALNEEIALDTRNLGAGYCIGHSYFCPSGNRKPDEGWYGEIIDSEIKPLLEEYWVDEPQRVSDAVISLLA